MTAKRTARDDPRRSHVALALAIFVVGALVQALWMDLRLAPYDEGLTLYGAARVLQGAIPHRDFWSLYGPGAFYALAAAFQLFGESVLTSRGVDVVYRCAIVTLVFVLARRMAPVTLAMAAAALSLFALVFAQSYAAPLFPATALALASVALVAKAVESPHDRFWPVLAGLAVGACLSYRQDVGVYALITACVGLSSVPRSNRPARTAFALLTGVAAIVVPLTAWMLVRVPVSALHDDFVRIPLTIYSSHRALPFPPLEGIGSAVRHLSLSALTPYIVYVPALVTMLVLGQAWWLRGRKDTREPPPPTNARTALFRMLLVLEAFMLLKGAVRVELLHMTPAFVVATILGAQAVARLPATRSRALLVVLGMVIAAKPLLSGETGWSAAERFQAIARAVANDRLTDACEATSPARGRCVRIDASLREVVQYIDANTTQDQAIYVGTGRHDKLLINNVEVYFLADRRSATRWHDLHPGVQTSLAIQQSMVDSFRTDPPALVALNREWDKAREPNRSADSSGVTLLDDWLRSHYEPVLERGLWTVMRPRVDGT